MRRRLLRPGLLLLALVAGLFAGTSHIGEGAEHALASLRDTLRAHDASGTVQIVEVDARSIAALEHWPWPRRHHAALIDRLRAAGASGIAFDVDFSARSSPEDDRRMVRALADAGGSVILPTFRQRGGGGSTAWIDSLPRPAMRAHSVLAAVSIDPDADGRVRRAPLGTITAGTPRPSLSAAIAGRSGTADESFPIDFAIEPASIPRHSVVDVLRGDLAPGALHGKTVVIGATAIELGDRYVVPRHGVIPGVVIQAMAAETLLRGVPVSPGWMPALLVAGLLAALVLAARRRWSLAATIAAAPVALFAGGLVLAGSGIDLAIVPALVTTTVASLAAVALRGWRTYQRRRGIDAASGLPNRLALVRQGIGAAGDSVVVVRIGAFEKFAAGLDAAQLGALLQRVAERVALVTDGAPVHRIDDRLLGWTLSGSTDPAIDDAFAALRSMMLVPVEVGGRRVDVALSGGVAESDGDAESTINNAALAAEHAQASGEPWHRFRPGEKAGLDRDLSLMGELDEAIARGDIRVLYQPKRRLSDGQITGVEALVRWQHATRGFMAPDLFIPLAERSDRIDRLTLHVLAIAIDDIKRWRDAGTPITAAVNLSANLVGDAAFMDALVRSISTGGIDPALVTIEVTESATMRDPAGAAAALAKLRAIGVAVSMDDYGTGQSTLSYLKTLPLDELKIDRSFVQHADTNRADAVLVRSTVELAHELGLRVVAEGVEDAECLAFLQSVGCDYAQGYHISRPVPAEDIAQLLAEPVAVAA